MFDGIYLESVLSKQSDGQDATYKIKWVDYQTFLYMIVRNV